MYMILTWGQLGKGSIGFIARSRFRERERERERERKAFVWALHACIVRTANPLSAEQIH